MQQLLFTLLLLSSFCVTANACSCVKLTASCNKAWNSGETVFFGKVSAVIDGEMQPIGNGAYRLSDHEIHFTSVEFFRGGNKTAREAVVFTGSGEGDCGYPFVAGISYLVYAFTDNGRLMTGICGETTPEGMMDGVLRELRALRDTGHVDNLFGTVRSREDWTETRPLANVPVYASSKRGRRFTTRTDEHGFYAFTSLPADKYQVNLDLPAGFMPDRNNQLFRAEIKTEETGAGCRVDASPRPDGRISGKVVGPNGPGLAGFITIERSNLQGTEVVRQRNYLFGQDTDHGSFSFKELPPGHYRLVFRPKIGRGISFQSRFSWPATTSNAMPNGLKLSLGQHIKNVRFEVSLTGNER